jgi:hypothetical protein
MRQPHRHQGEMRNRHHCPGGRAQEGRERPKPYRDSGGRQRGNDRLDPISETMTKSKENVVTATARVDAADAQVQKLSAASQAMSGIVELIGNITSQINLLALNAMSRHVPAKRTTVLRSWLPRSRT